MREQTVIVDQATRLARNSTWELQGANRDNAVSNFRDEREGGRWEEHGRSQSGDRTQQLRAKGSPRRRRFKPGQPRRPARYCAAIPAGTCTPRKVDIEDALVSPYPNLKILPGSSGDVDYPEMTTIVQQRFLQDLFSLEEHFDILLIDTSAGLSRETVTYSLESDEAIVVTSIEPTSVMDSYAVIKTISISRPDERISVLMNAAQIPNQADETVQKLRMAVDHFLKRDIGYLGSIPFDANMRNAVLAQEPVMKRYPRERSIAFVESCGTNHHQSIPYSRVRKTPMKTIVFELGLLAFFVSAVVFGAQGASLFDMIARAFIVFIGIELAATTVFAMVSQRPRQAEAEVRENLNDGQPAKRRTPAVQAKA